MPTERCSVTDTIACAMDDADGADACIVIIARGEDVMVHRNALRQWEAIGLLNAAADVISDEGEDAN